jgi:hypothetical protein
VHNSAPVELPRFKDPRTATHPSGALATTSAGESDTFVGIVGYSRLADVMQKGPSDWTSPPGEGRDAGGIRGPTNKRPSGWIVDWYVAKPVGAGPDMYVPLSLHLAPWKTSSKVRLVEHHATSLASPHGTWVEYPSITSTVPSS